jgi:hypothetical protein
MHGPATQSQLEWMEKLQCLATFQSPSSLLEEHWPNHANLVSISCRTTCPTLQLSTFLSRIPLLHSPSFHELLPRFWIHQAWWPLTS